jgi:hypothetical protein
MTSKPRSELNHSEYSLNFTSNSINVNNHFLKSKHMLYKDS